MSVPVTTWTVAAMGLFAYLLGGIPVGLVLVRLARPRMDVRSLGSGNIGTSNIYRNVDVGLAVVVGPLQFLQGLLPVALATRAGFPLAVVGLTAVCSVIGNGWPVYAGFNGGRGIAVATGAVGAMRVLAGFLLLPLVGALVVGRAEAAAFAALLALVLLRRLEGALSDARHDRRPWRMLARRLARDQRPGRPLVGRRTDG
jgi:glycerol-3-phosphate acyltransferase PlsY